jgi:hypothetical protein
MHGKAYPEFPEIQIPAIGKPVNSGSGAGHEPGGFEDMGLAPLRREGFHMQAISLVLLQLRSVKIKNPVRREGIRRERIQIIHPFHLTAILSFDIPLCIYRDFLILVQVERTYMAEFHGCYTTDEDIALNYQGILTSSFDIHRIGIDASYYKQRCGGQCREAG